MVFHFIFNFLYESDCNYGDGDGGLVKQVYSLSFFFFPSFSTDETALTVTVKKPFV